MAGEQPSDEELERKLRELYDEVSSQHRIREPSAAERAAAARRAGRKAGKARKQRTGKSGRRRLPQARAWLIAGVCAAAVAAIVVVRLPGSSSGPGNDSQPVRNGPVPHLAATTPAAPPADPFAGTPAGAYATGATGITTPMARPVGDYTAAEVGAAYATTRQLLIAANLDWQTLRGGAPNAFAALLIPRERSEFVAGLDKIGFDKQGYALSTRAWVTAFAPGSTTFVTTTVKVHGAMTARAATESNGTHYLKITVDYIFVYAVEPPHDPAGWMRIVDQTTGDAEFAQWDDPGGALEPWAQFGNAPAGGRCGMDDGYVHPEFPDTAPGSVQPSGPAVNPYVLSTAVPKNHCQATTGT
jgi:hypothetical protein